MGNYYETCCKCGKTKTIIPDTTSNEYTQKEKETMKEQSLLLNTNTRLPSNIMQMRFKTKNLIQKRIESPFEQYTIESNLGSGSFGNVYKVSHRSNNVIRALKQIPKKYITDGYNENQISNEIQILRLLDHPNIMKIYEFYEDNDNFYILSEFCDEGDLKSKCEKHGKFSEFNVRFFMYQILNAVAYLHTNRVIHGDIKLENILLYANNETNAIKYEHKISKRLSQIAFDINIDDIQEELRQNQDNRKSCNLNNCNMNINDDEGKVKRTLTVKTEQYLTSLSNYEIKLIDFGCSKIFTKKKLNAVIGTNVYCSPEVIDNSFTEKCDEWSCGVLMYFLLSNILPFYAETEEELFYKIKHDKIEFPKEYFGSISTECIDLIKKLLIKDPSKRISARNALKEPFFIGGINPQ
jgi:calcium-dependent protein kinase